MIVVYTMLGPSPHISGHAGEEPVHEGHGLHHWPPQEEGHSWQERGGGAVHSSQKKDQ